MSALTEQQLQDVILWAYKNPVNGRPLSEKNPARNKNCLTAFVKYARKQPLTKLYPENLYIPAGATKSQKEPLQPEDIKLLFNCNRTKYRGKEVEEWYINVYRTAVITGMRPGELFALKATDIKDSVCTIQGSLNAYGESTRGKKQKTPCGHL